MAAINAKNNSSKIEATQARTRLEQSLVEQLSLTIT